MMIGLKSVNDLLNRNPALFTLAVLMMFASTSWNSYQAQAAVKGLAEFVEHQTYDYSFRLISRGLAGSDTGSAALDKTKFWRDNGWDAQLTAMNILCDEPGRSSLLSIVPTGTAVDICRMVR